MPGRWRRSICCCVMGKIGLIIIISAIAAYAADQRWNDSRYTDSTAAVLRHAQRALGF